MRPTYLSIFLLAEVLAGVPGYDPTTDQDKVICVYPLSGQYALLQRYLYYALLVFSIVNHRHTWLVGGALATVIFSSTAAAIHLCILALSSASRTTSSFDLDSVGAWSIVSVAALVGPPMISGSWTIFNNRLRSILAAWSLLENVGSIFGAVALFHSYPLQAACRSSTGELLQSGSLNGLDIDCIYPCFQKRQLLRNLDDIFVIEKKRAYGDLYTILYIAVLISIINVSFAGIWSSFLGPKKHTRAELESFIQIYADRESDSPKTKCRNAKVRNAAQKELDSGVPQQFSLKRFFGRMFDGDEFSSGLPSQRGWISLFLEPCTIIFGPCFLVVVLVMNEYYIQGEGGIPSSDRMDSVGQWTPWVVVSLSIIGVFWVKLQDMRGEGKKWWSASEKETHANNPTQLLAAPWSTHSAGHELHNISSTPNAGTDLEAQPVAAFGALKTRVTV